MESQAKQDRRVSSRGGLRGGSYGGGGRSSLALDSERHVSAVQPIDDEGRILGRLSLGSSRQLSATQPISDGKP